MGFNSLPAIFHPNGKNYTSVHNCNNRRLDLTSNELVTRVEIIGKLLFSHNPHHEASTMHYIFINNS